MRDSGHGEKARDSEREVASGAERAKHGQSVARLGAGVAALFYAMFYAVPSYAHAGTGLPGGFVAGVEHPLTGPDHMLAMASVGIWGAFLGRPMIYLLPMVFPIMMAIGAGFGIGGVPLPRIEVGIALSVCILGVLIAGAVRTSVAVACGIVGLFALFHGYSHGLELPSAADPIGYSLGFVFATGSLHVLGIGVGTLDRVRHGVIALRALGGLIALSGVWFMTQALA
jgi:urease accessory protein